MVIWFTKKFSDSIWPKPQLFMEGSIPPALQGTERFGRPAGVSLPASTRFFVFLNP